uniref:Uncharacterized protein n=1 Tax=Parascaris univalens TaxID=6257 RepID=A0A914ZV31_PARUN
MVYRFVRQLLNQERMIQQMADSSLIRTAARMFVSSLFGFKRLAQQSNALRGVSKRVEIFSDTFKREFQKSLTQKK